MAARRVAAALGLALAALLAPACDSGNPVAPAPPEQPGPGESFTITLSSVPERLQAGSAEPATVTVVVRRRSDGLAPADGTEVTVNTDRGSLGVADPAKTLATLALAGGRAQVAFFPGAEVGEATLLAQVVTSIGMLTVPIVEALPSNFFLTGLTPAFGHPDGGERVRITGAGFATPLRATFGGVVAAVVSVGANAVEVDTPPSAMPLLPGQSLAVDVTVTNTLDQPQPPSDTLTGAYTYTRDAAPSFFLTAVSPDRGDPAGGETVSIFGGGIRAPVVVEFGGVTAPGAVVVSDGEIRVQTPAAPAAVPPGGSLVVDVSVANALGSETPSAATIAGGFTYSVGTPSAIVVTGLEPTTGDYRGGDVVTLRGRDLPPTAAVELAGVRQLDEVTVSSTEIRFTTAAIVPSECPANGRVPQTGITVTDLDTGNQGSAALTFTYLVPSPRIDRVSPAAGLQSGNLAVTLEGADFVAPLRVVFAHEGREFAAVIEAVEGGRVRVRSPRLPDDVFPEVDCIDVNNQVGKRFVSVTADVRVEDLTTGCADTFANAFTYTPSDGSCRVVIPPPPPPMP